MKNSKTKKEWMGYIVLLSISIIFTFTYTLQSVSAGEAYKFLHDPVHVKYHNKITTRSQQFSPDGKTCVIVNAPATIQIYNTQSWRLIKSFQIDTNPIMAVAYSPDGKLIATGGYKKGDILIWEVAQGKVVKKLTEVQSIVSLDFSPSGRYLVSSEIIEKPNGTSSVKLWNLKSGKLIKRIFHEKVSNYYPAQVRYSPDEGLIAIAFANNKRGIGIFDFKTRKMYTIPTKDDVYAIDFNPVRLVLASGGGSGGNTVIQTWNVRTRKQIKEMSGYKGFINSIQYTPDGKYIVSTAAERKVRFRVTEAGSGVEVQVRTTKSRQKSSGMSMSPDGRLISVHLTSTGNLGNPPTIEFYTVGND
jgi:WD40 repeat protein